MRILILLGCLATLTFATPASAQINIGGRLGGNTNVGSNVGVAVGANTSVGVNRSDSDTDRDRRSSRERHRNHRTHANAYAAAQNQAGWGRRGTRDHAEASGGVDFHD
jgi:hypothetical protein